MNSIDRNIRAFMFLIAVAPAITQGADRLYSEQMILAPNQYIQSAKGNYTLTFDSAGTMKILRSDGSVRYVMTSGADFAVMQSDGNFVAYKNYGIPLWWTGTQNNPGSYVTLHDTGDLIVRTFSVPQYVIWSLGSDYIFGDPTKVGDVVGRDLAAPAVGFLGHLGIWNGQAVYEVGPPKSGTNNAVHMETIFDFKHTQLSNGTDYAYFWGTASYKVPAGTMIKYGCWESACTYPTSVSAEIRYSIALRAEQIRRIGADYTTSTEYRSANFAYAGYPMQRGLYRCDTFVVDTISISTTIPYPNQEHKLWQDRVKALRAMWPTPKGVFDKLKTYQ